MNTALVTTTIHRPDVLQAYRRIDPDVTIIVAGDRKTPHVEVEALCDSLGNARYLSPRDQGRLYPALSEVIGWDCVQRRNIATLVAAELEPDVIVTVDTDNVPLGNYFADLERSFEPHVGAGAEEGWFNIGEHGRQRFRYRGLPYGIPVSGETCRVKAEAQIGVVNGLIFGDPDINATERIESAPEVDYYSTEAIGGISVDPQLTWTSVNSQNTAYRLELAPLMAVLPGVGRYDDIWGSYLMQRVLSATDYQILFDRPWVRQDRHPHDLLDDLEAEMLGMRETNALTALLSDFQPSPDGSPLENLAALCEALSDYPHLPHEFLDRWLEVWA